MHAIATGPTSKIRYHAVIAAIHFLPDRTFPYSALLLSGLRLLSSPLLSSPLRYACIQYVAQFHPPLNLFHPLSSPFFARPADRRSFFANLPVNRLRVSTFTARRANFRPAIYRVSILFDSNSTVEKVVGLYLYYDRHSSCDCSLWFGLVSRNCDTTLSWELWTFLS